MTVDADPVLLARLRTGDREAFAVLVARHIGLVQAACRRQAAPGEEDDCVQAVFLILARKPSAAARSPALPAWLLRVAWFVCRNSRRVARRRRQAERSAAAAAPVDRAARPEALDHLDDCLHRLPERQRAAVSLHYLAGRPAEEVAAVLGTSRDNAYQLISRGLAGLRQLLARRGVAVAGAGLASLLAAEAQAATATAQPAALLASLSGTPSLSVTTLSNGALHAMTIATLTPFAAVAGLALTLGTTAVLLGAEPTVPRAPAADPPAVAPVAAPVAAPAPPVAATPPDPMLGGWNSMDTKMTAADLAQKILAGPWLAAFTKAQNRAPKLIIGKVAVRAEGETIDAAPLRETVERELLKSGKVAIMVDPGMTDQAADPSAPRADIAVQGTIRLVVEREGADTVKLFTVTMQGIEDKSGNLLFSVESGVRKEIQKPRWK